MVSTHTEPARFRRILRIAAILMAFVVAVVVLLLWLAGTFARKVETSTSRLGNTRPIGTARVVEVVARTLPVEETAVGAIQPVHRIDIASRILARVLEVDVIAGQSVKKGDVLVRLEETDLASRRSQAESAVAQAQSVVDQARSETLRLRPAFEKNAVSGVELDRAESALKGAEANLARTQQALTEAETVVSFATIQSPIDGQVVDKRVNSGDTVSPGQVVVTVLDPTRMQLVASVRESLSRYLSVGGSVSVRVDVLDHACSGIVSEIVPESEAASRTFQVRVTGPCPEGVHAGMFGRLSIPVGDETVILIPKDSVRVVGQLECVDVASNGARERRAIRSGRTIEGQLEVLSGLVAGEKIVVDAAVANERR